MYEKLRFSMNGCMYFFMWSMFNFNVTCGLCPAVFNGGYIDPKCTRILFCNVYCNPGFDKTDHWLFCVKGEYWLPNPSSVCIKSVTCPAIFNDGYIVPPCSRLPGNACTFYCNPGFVKKGNQLICGKNGMWIQDTNSICIKSDSCPAIFNDGYIESSCSRLPGNSCTFYCNPGFAKKGNQLTCGTDGMWIQDTNSICIKSNPCPDVFKGGYIEPSCSRVSGDSCTFYCNPGFVKKNNFPIFCGNYGNWIPDTNSICMQSVEHRSSSSGQVTGGELSLGAILAITIPLFLSVMIIIIVCILARKAKRSSVRKSQSVLGRASRTCLRPRENRDQDVTTLRQQPNADGFNSASSFESPSSNGIYVHSLEQRIPSISSSCKYYEPPPSYTETQIAANEAPPTYTEAVRDHTSFNSYNFNLYI